MDAAAREKIGKKIKESRLEKGLTQLEVSEKTGLSRNYISDIENGRYAPSVEALTSIAACLTMDLNFLHSVTEIQAS
ncbi:MAG: iduronate sulfatase [Peptococcaceae bacterium BICA1-7]|nr:MAG: iduronate sulfatase [Peptococcaceae bacterium BICA1-7]HBV97737.1 XRE family transcriptional regulator [Desulfotomaculum sp.]